MLSLYTYKYLGGHMVNFTKIINASIENKSRREREPHVYWPSEASLVSNGSVIGKCHRASYYNYTGIIPTNPIYPSSIRKMEAGSSIEYNEHKFAERAGILVDHNVKRRKEYDSITISAEIDAIYKYLDKTSIIEIKSMGGYFARKQIFGNKSTPGKPKEEHVLQTTLYNDIYPEHDGVVIRYIDRTDCDIIEHRVTLQEVTVPSTGASNHMVVVNGSVWPDFSLERIIDRYKILDDWISKNTRPPRDFDPEEKKQGKKTVRAWQCSYCQWLNQCLEDGE